MKKIIGLLLVAAIAVLGTGCEKDEKSETGFSGSYTFGGSTTLEPIFLDVNKVMESMYDVQLSYDAPGSSGGVNGVLDGIYTLGAASRDLKPSEIEKGAKSTPIGVDGVAVVVNKETVQIDNLTQDQVAKIYAGEITNWSEIGGADAEIVVLNRDEASGTRSCFKDGSVKTIDSAFVSDAIIVTSNGDMVSKVGSTPHAIGYCGFGYIGKDSGTKTINVNGVEPIAENVVKGSYVISRFLNVITKGDLEEGSFEKHYLNYMLSKDGQSIVKSLDFIPLQ